MESLTRHWTKRLLMTPGVLYVAETAGAHWLVDAIASHVGDWRLHKEEFLVWRLEVREDRTARLVADDGNGVELLEQEIPYTDYPEPECEMYLVLQAGGPGTEAILMLSAEY